MAFPPFFCLLANPRLLSSLLGSTTSQPSPLHSPSTPPRPPSPAPTILFSAPQEVDIKLASYDDATRIKVIKEVRGATGLGLKEAKELVESAPCVLAKSVLRADAEAMAAKLEAVGAKIELV